MRERTESHKSQYSRLQKQFTRSKFSNEETEDESKQEEELLERLKNNYREIEENRPI